MSDEPVQHRRYLILLGICGIASAPFPFAGRELRMLAGLPAWLWWSLAFTTALALLSCFGILRYWKDDEGD